MAGNDDGDGIVVVRLAYGTRCEWRANFGSKLGVGPSLAERDAQKRLPATLMKRRAAQIEREIELVASPGKILIQLVSHIAEAIRFLNPAHVLGAVRSNPSAMKRNHGQTALTHGKVEVADWGVVSGREEELRWLRK
jgi:hypothetical protein